MIERSLAGIKISASDELYAVAFAASGEHLLSGGRRQDVGVWQVQDGRRVASIAAEGVTHFGVSGNGRWISGGTATGEVCVWNARTYEQVWSQKEDQWTIHALDFSPDSTRLVSGSGNGTATIWDVKTGKKVLTLDHNRSVVAAKYSPDGERIATATFSNGSVLVWDNTDGRLLIDDPVEVTPWYNGLIWSNDHVFVVSGCTIQELDTSTGSTVAKWSVPGGDIRSCIVLPKHGRFIIYSTAHNVTFWDTSTHLQLGLIEHPNDICAVALSPDDGSLAISEEDGTIVVTCPSCSMDSFTCSSPHFAFRDPDLWVGDTILDAWEQDHLDDVHTFLTTAIHESQQSNHDLLAARALVRVRLQDLDAALVDANMAIEIQPSFIAYIVKSLAYVSMGDRHAAYRTCDVAFQYFHSVHVTLLLLIKAIIIFLAGEHSDAISRMDDLISIVPCRALCCTVQAYMHLHIGNMHVENGDYDHAIRSFELARARCYRIPMPLVIALVSGWKFADLHTTVRRRLCETLYAAGRRKEASESLLEMVSTSAEEVNASESITEWVSHFTEKCLSMPESIDDVTLPANPDTNAAMPHTTAIMLFKEWAKSKLACDSWKSALRFAVNFVLSKSMIYWAICEQLETTDRVTDAIECFRQMMSERVDEENVPGQQTKWVNEFKRRCMGKLENLGDVAARSEQHDDAISHYSAALTLNPVAPQGLLIKRSKEYLAKSLWVEALSDANKVIKLDPMSPWGHERKHAALHSAGDYRGAVNAFEKMFSRMSQSSDPEIRALHHKYVNPGETRAIIRKAVQDALRNSPRVLIHTLSGRLLNKREQAASFELLPVFDKLVSSMTTRIDDVFIERSAGEYSRYAMFSHKWEGHEPLFEKVIRTVVYNLKESPTHKKLKMFCKIVKDAGLHWAWSDTCCINKADHVVLQEALVSMFKWYRGSALTVVFLLDVPSPSRRGELTRSIWNTRAWTFQEYHASNVVRFYTRDWKLYMDLDIQNHKESPEIISEMEEATGVSARALIALQPGLDDVREKLCLASMRQTTLVEDTAYSLLGIFSMSMQVIYGEGDQALGRLLAQLLASSGDTGIVAWTGKSGSFNSCMPANLTVFRQLSPTHIPPTVAADEMEKITTMLRASSLNPALFMTLYDQFLGLPVPSFAGQRLKLPCLVFKLGTGTIARSAGGRVFRAQTDALGIVEIKTAEDIAQFSPLYLVHPWIDFLLDRQPVGSVSASIPIPAMISEEDIDDPLLSSSWSAGTSTLPLAAPKAGMAGFTHLFGMLFGRLTIMPSNEAASLLPPSTLSPEDKLTRALQMIARLKQPFGALLLAQNPGKVAAYRRVATETLIMVKLGDVTPAVLRKLVSGVRVLDVL